MTNLKLYMLLLGCRPTGRNIEQHDVFFTIGTSLKGLIPAINQFWKEAKGVIHIDGWREVTKVGEYQISVEERNERTSESQSLFFINLGGYKPEEMEEYHYKILEVATTKSQAVARAKDTAFYRHTGFGAAAAAHIDDRYGVDADDIHDIKDILPVPIRERYRILVSPAQNQVEDELHLGYLPLAKI